jgi:hypothetical protein
VSAAPTILSASLLGRTCFSLSRQAQFDLESTSGFVSSGWNGPFVHWDKEEANYADVPAYIFFTGYGNGTGSTFVGLQFSTAV